MSTLHYCSNLISLDSPWIENGSEVIITFYHHSTPYNNIIIID